MSSRSHNSNRPGYTLLEVILASMLAAAVMLIIATSIEIQFRAFKAGRSHVEEAQLARVLLRRIDDDLRAVVPATGITESVSSTTSNEDSSTSKDTDSDSGLADDEKDGRDHKDEDDGDAKYDEETTLAGATPGVYGDLNMLRIDVVRAKRIGGSSADESPSADVTSGNGGEIETIVYYVLAPEESAAGTDSEDAHAGGGLVRRVLVGPTAAWASENGLLEYYDTTVASLAAEVTAVEFRYHDGKEWLESWNSSSNGSLPKAFEIRLFFARQTAVHANSLQGTGGVPGRENDLPGGQYRLIVPVLLQGQCDVAAIKPPDETDKSSASDDGDQKNDPSGDER